MSNSKTKNNNMMIGVECEKVKAMELKEAGLSMSEPLEFYLLKSEAKHLQYCELFREGQFLG